TVADVVPLLSENRILVKAGLSALHRTSKTGLLALIEACSLIPEQLTAYHLGFVIGPSFNAVGRLSDVKTAFELLQTKDERRACMLASEIRALNERRRDETVRGTEEAVEIVENAPWKEDRILLVRLHGVHESVVGIIAGRLKELYRRPVYVFTDAEEGIKGSGRSVEAYHMLDGLIPAKGLLTRFGGHAMAAGLSLPEENLEELRSYLNESCTLTEKDLQPVVHVDARVPFRYVTENLTSELAALAPYGTGNPRPVFALTHLNITSLRVVGKKQNVVRMTLRDEYGDLMDAVHFSEPEALFTLIREEFGEKELEKALHASNNSIDLAFTFYPDINEYMGRKSVQIVCTSYCRIR
ncbi:MAG: single-stranded-DNA-specific exonuclease RecJ, partial [Lachnospiraceae bacterium]|nr:single-stranded-DNA-specific exonuclease RecJ [Lachnospiraceae bacterium]